MIDNLIKRAIDFYSENNLSIPNSVTEYINKFPPGLSRQVLKDNYGIKCSDFIAKLNPNYSKVLSAKDRVIVECARLGYILVSPLEDITTNRSIVTIICDMCGYTHHTTITSLQGSKHGCPLCKAGNLPWHQRKQELVAILSSNFDAELVSDIPPNQTGYITVRHLPCGTSYTTQLLGIVSPNSKLRGTCPNCRSSDRRVTYNNYTFGSEFELECYKKLEYLHPEVHVPYNKYIDTCRRWVCDFKLGNYWIEVSNFKQDFKGYFANIEDKRVAVESSGDIFLFITSIAELEEIISLM